MLMGGRKAIQIRTRYLWLLVLYFRLPARQSASHNLPFLSWESRGGIARVAFSLHRCKTINILLPSPTHTDIIVETK